MIEHGAMHCALPLLLMCSAMNEMTWRKVQDWEQLHCQECKYPTLLKFQGKPHDLRCACAGDTPAAAAAAPAAMAAPA